MRLIALLIGLWLAWPGAAFAQPIVTSAAPDSVSVTIYRDPHRGSGNLSDSENSLGGYALITETRVVELPPGEVVIRFEGVASGIQPESAITLGLGVAERNQDRLLLSERGLLDAFTGQSVILRRTDPATGVATNERARIRSGPDGVIVETAAGFEAMHCTGLNETLLYPGVPQTLAAKPVLSVTTTAQAGGRQRITLSYLAGNFDWQANYVGELSPDASRVDLFAWVTLASRDEISFPDAQTNAVAGRVAREEQDEDYRGGEELYAWAQCWPTDTTGSPGYAVPPHPAAPAPVVSLRMETVGYVGGDEESGSIVVTGSRIASQEELGDLKLYRIPFRVTVASNSQKQVAFLSKKNVKGRLLYRSKIDNWNDPGDDLQLLFRVENDKEAGLGEPLPYGRVALFQQAAGLRLLVGEATLADKAVGETVDLVFGEPFNVEVDEEYLDEDGGADWEPKSIIVTNANPFPIRYEAEFTDWEERRFENFSRRLERRDGKWVWSVTVPANGKAKLRYREVDVETQDE